MKKVLMMLIAIVAITVSEGSAKTLTSNLGFEKLKSQTEFVLDLGSIDALTAAEIEQKVEEFIQNNVPNVQLNCTITVKGSVNVGIVEFEIEVSVTGSCAEIAKSGKKIANQILSDVTSAIKGVK